MKNEEKIETLKDKLWRISSAYWVIMNAIEKEGLSEEKFLEAVAIGDITIEELTEIIHSL